MEKLLARGKCVCLAMLPLEPGWNWVWIVSYTGCRCAHAAVREEEYKQEAEEETFFPLVPHLQKRQCCRQERGTRARGGKGWQRKQRATEMPTGCTTANSVPCPLQSFPPAPATHHPTPQEVLWSKGPAVCGVISAGFKEVQNQNTEMKWEFLCQVPSEPERLVYSLMKFLLQSLLLFSTRDLCFL